MNIDEALYQLKQRIKMHELEGTTSNENEREKALLDYITNLQEENEKLQKRNKEIYDGFIATQKELSDYATRNEKAIEYIKQNSKCGGSFIDDKFVIEYIDEIFNGMELLNILNGDDE